jgi:hypothetical protein
MAGTMTVLTDSIGDVDTSDQLMMAEAFQKCWIANGTNLKIVDFINVKLTTAATTVVPRGTILTQVQGGGNALMLVDFSTTTEVFGYAYYTGSVTAFVVGTAVTGGPASFTPTAVTNAPHWRTWAPMPDSGEMPETAYLICRYRNRLVLSGNPKEPNQWYMCRSGDPHDWEYTANDAGSPVKGNEADAGQIGDIIRALAPHKDDFLVFGCVNSIWVLFGDPCEGGQSRVLTEETGMFGATSWCWGPDSAFYFCGNNGLLYRATIPGGVTNLSVKRIPNVARDNPFAAPTHRVSMAFDKDRTGILITVTRLETAENLNYWYGLQATEGEGKLGGFFPEVYPPTCAAYSILYYDSDTSANKALLLGGADGYIRKFDDSKKNDDTGAAEAAIESYVGFGPFPMGDGERKEGTIESLDLTTATGIASTSDDSGDVDYKVFSGRTAADVVKSFESNTLPKVAGSFKGPGNRRGSTRRQKARGLYGMLRIGNSVIDKSWAFESLEVSGDLSGKAK